MTALTPICKYLIIAAVIGVIVFCLTGCQHPPHDFNHGAF